MIIGKDFVKRLNICYVKYKLYEKMFMNNLINVEFITEKICKICNIKKNIIFFYKNNFKYINECKECINNKHKKYNENNSEKIKKYQQNYQKQYKIKNKEKIKQRDKKYSI